MISSLVIYIFYFFWGGRGEGGGYFLICIFYSTYWIFKDEEYYSDFAQF